MDCRLNADKFSFLGIFALVDLKIMRQGGRGVRRGGASVSQMPTFLLYLKSWSNAVFGRDQIRVEAPIPKPFKSPYKDRVIGGGTGGEAVKKTAFRRVLPANTHCSSFDLNRLIAENVSIGMC